jgi:hypothetical protein
MATLFQHWLKDQEPMSPRKIGQNSPGRIIIVEQVFGLRMQRPGS